MKLKLILVGALVGAFLLGALFEGYVRPQLSNALTSPQNTATLSAPAAPRAARRSVVYREPAESPRIHHRRSWERQVLIVAGSSGAGAGIGALAGGARGAGIGALSGGVAGLVYNLATRNR